MEKEFIEESKLFNQQGTKMKLAIIPAKVIDRLGLNGTESGSRPIKIVTYKENDNIIGIELMEEEEE